MTTTVRVNEYDESTDQLVITVNVTGDEPQTLRLPASFFYLNLHTAVPACLEKVQEAHEDEAPNDSPLHLQGRTFDCYGEVT